MGRRSQLEGIPAEILRFRQMPLPEEVARLAQVAADRSNL
jgi:hypothetical protein